MYFQYLQPKQHYIDRYDLQTIKECLSWYWKIRNGMRKHCAEHESTSPETNFDDEVHKCCSYIVNSIKGERYRHRNEQIQQWMARDEQRQNLQDTTPEPRSCCKSCGSSVKLLDKDLHDFGLNDQPRMLFIFECTSCKKRQAVYEDGSPWEYQRERCKQCGTELDQNYKFNKKTEVTTITTYCPTCSFKEVETENYKLDRKRRQAEEAKDAELLTKFRQEFCLDDTNGPEYVQSLDVMSAFAKRMKADDEKKKDPNYQKALQLKQLKLSQLKDLLNKAVITSGYTDFNTGKPEMGKFVTVDFTCSDTNDNRAAYDSRSMLKKLIQTSLSDTNWKLMNDGVSYRLGILSGRLRAYEREEDLMRISTTVPENVPTELLSYAN